MPRACKNALKVRVRRLPEEEHNRVHTRGRPLDRLIDSGSYAAYVVLMLA
jgi:hypothetical protein